MLIAKIIEFKINRLAEERAFLHKQAKLLWVWLMNRREELFSEREFGETKDAMRTMGAQMNSLRLSIEDNHKVHACLTFRNIRWAIQPGGAVPLFRRWRDLASGKQRRLLHLIDVSGKSCSEVWRTSDVCAMTMFFQHARMHMRNERDAAEIGRQRQTAREWEADAKDARMEMEQAAVTYKMDPAGRSAAYKRARLESLSKKIKVLWRFRDELMKRRVVDTIQKRWYQGRMSSFDDSLKLRVELMRKKYRLQIKELSFRTAARACHLVLLNCTLFVIRRAWRRYYFHFREHQRQNVLLVHRDDFAAHKAQFQRNVRLLAVETSTRALGYIVAKWDMETKATCIARLQARRNHCRRRVVAMVGMMGWVNLWASAVVQHKWQQMCLNYRTDTVATAMVATKALCRYEIRDELQAAQEAEQGRIEAAFGLRREEEVRNAKMTGCMAASVVRSYLTDMSRLHLQVVIWIMRYQHAHYREAAALQADVSQAAKHEIRTSKDLYELHSDSERKLLRLQHAADMQEMEEQTEAMHRHWIVVARSGALIVSVLTRIRHRDTASCLQRMKANWHSMKGSRDHFLEWVGQDQPASEIRNLRGRNRDVVGTLEAFAQGLGTQLRSKAARGLGRYLARSFRGTWLMRTQRCLLRWLHGTHSSRVVVAHRRQTEDHEVQNEELAARYVAANAAREAHHKQVRKDTVLRYEDAFRTTMAMYVFETALRVAKNYKRWQAVLGWRLRTKDFVMKRRAVQQMRDVEEEVRSEMQAVVDAGSLDAGSDTRQKAARLLGEVFRGQARTTGRIIILVYIWRAGALRDDNFVLETLDREQEGYIKGLKKKLAGARESEAGAQLAMEGLAVHLEDLADMAEAAKREQGQAQALVVAAMQEGGASHRRYRVAFACHWWRFNSLRGRGDVPGLRQAMVALQHIAQSEHILCGWDELHHRVGRYSLLAPAMPTSNPKPALQVLAFMKLIQDPAGSTRLARASVASDEGHQLMREQEHMVRHVAGLLER